MSIFLFTFSYFLLKICLFGVNIKLTKEILIWNSEKISED
nr:MAG TPA: hypothetical protein [Caudoviricetes sp.]